MARIRISGTGSSVPEKVLTNFDLEKMVETNDSWIRERTGIHERHICDDATSASDLATIAAQKALANSGYSIEEIDLILVATTTPDHPLFPSIGALLQENLKAPFTPAFDISAACTGFIYAFTTAAAYIRSGMYQKILLVCVDTLSKSLDWEDRGTCILFGDGSAAMVLESSESPQESGLLGFDLHADGSGSNMLIVPSGGSRKPYTPESYQERDCFIKMDGQAVYKFAVNAIVKTVNETMKQARITKDDVKFFIPHQANIRIINFAAKKLGFNEEQVKVNLEKYGNTSSASIPLVIDEMNQAGEIQRGDIIIAVGFGAGLTWGSTIFRW